MKLTKCNFPQGRKTANVVSPETLFQELAIGYVIQSMLVKRSST